MLKIGKFWSDQKGNLSAMHKLVVHELSTQPGKLNQKVAQQMMNFFDFFHSAVCSDESFTLRGQLYGLGYPRQPFP